MQRYDFFENAVLKKKYLNLWIKDSRSYKNSGKKKIGIVMVLAAVIVIITAGISDFLQPSYSTAPSLLPVGFTFAAVLVIFGGLLEETARKEAAFPYINYDNEYLKLYDDGLEYVFHDKKSSYSLYKYRIPQENIHTVVYDEKHHYITISGKYELSMVDEMGGERTCSNRTYDDSTFAFFITCSEADERAIVSALKGMADKIVDMECTMPISKIAY